MSVLGFPVLEVEGMDLVGRNKWVVETCPPDPLLACSCLRGTREVDGTESLFVLMPLPVRSWEDGSERSHSGSLCDPTRC